MKPQSLKELLKKLKNKLLIVELTHYKLLIMQGIILFIVHNLKK